MPNLGPPDVHFLNAAIGWMELGNLREARRELLEMKPALQLHPDVLEVRWSIAVGAENWQEALESARALIQVAPERHSGWVHQAYALRRVPEGGLKTAWQALLPVFDKFPKEPIISYNLSCYACQLGQLDAARVWLKRALVVGKKEPIKEMALEEPDLKPLWDEIRQF
jgi:hypothetical protein